MAEYIDRDELLKELCTVSAPTPSESWIVEKCIEKVNEQPTADVAPKSEVEKLQKQLAEMLVSEQTELHIPMEYLVRVRTEHPIYKAIKTKVAREIFEEIEGCFMFGERIYSIDKPTFAELKKKYIGESDVKRDTV